MQSLEALTKEAMALAANEVVVNPVMSSGEAEVARIMQICNACRYCEGFCAVFPAMTRRLEFGRADIHYLSNLCHSCGACLHACQYAPPHEFGVNVPKAMAQVRVQTYMDFAWPAPLGALYKRNGIAMTLAIAFGLSLFLMIATFGAADANQVARANFYAVVPHNTLAWMFGGVFLLAMIALGMGVRQFWREKDPGNASFAAAAETASDVLTLRYLGGGHGDGCNNDDDAFSLARRRFHHLTFYGFLLCFASTCVATLYHYVFHEEAPYPLLSAPVLLGTIGGVSLCLGVVGLLWLNIRRHPLHGDTGQRAMDRGFMVLLILVSLSGLALLAFRTTPAMSMLLCLHLGVVMALFLTLPYGKFAHGIFRCAALLKWSIEKRRPSSLLVEE